MFRNMKLAMIFFAALCIGLDPVQERLPPKVDVGRFLAEVVERTGCRQVRLAFSSAVSKFEGAEIIPRFGFDDHFQGQVFGFGPYDKGVPISVSIGFPSVLVASG